MQMKRGAEYDMGGGRGVASRRAIPTPQTMLSAGQMGAQKPGGAGRKYSRISSKKRRAGGWPLGHSRSTRQPACRGCVCRNARGHGGAVSALAGGPQQACSWEQQVGYCCMHTAAC